jgi:hypothetical protein
MRSDWRVGVEGEIVGNLNGKMLGIVMKIQ